MGKLDIGVGDEFPVDDPPPPSPEGEETICAAREECDRQREEWRRRKDEWRAQRDAWREEVRARRDAFKSDLRNSLHENFGYRRFPGNTTFAGRILVGLAVLALIVALLPFLFMFVFVALAIVLFFFGISRGGRRNDPPERSNPSQPSQ